MRHFILLFTVCLTTQLFSQQKLAMIVAVGQYPFESRIPPIAAVNDVKYIKAVLNKHGFADKNITTLVNAKATKAAILKSLTDLAVKAKSKDIVVVNFGCHGQQIRDQRTIELGKDEDDGYDEALLPYDAKARYSPTGYKGEKHLRDDDLYPKLLAIRKKIGPEGSLLVLIDACHSGTGTRAEGFATTRGEPVPFPDPENPVDSVINLSAAEARQGFFEAMTDSLSNMVVISGSSPHQENKQVIVDYEELGSLSYAFYKAMSDMPTGNTYELLFEKIKAVIQSYVPDQVPVVEGKTNQVIFSGRYIPKTDRLFIRVGVKGQPSPADSVFTTDRGMIDNMKAGMVCKIYKAGTDQLVANAVILKTEHFRSIGVADKLLKKAELYEMKTDETGFGNLQAGVKLQLNSTPGKQSVLDNQVREWLKPYRFLGITDNADFQLALQSGASTRKAVLTDRNNQQLWSTDIPEYDSLAATDKASLIASMKNAMRIKYLRTITDGGELASLVTAEIIPDKQESTALVLQEGDGYSLRIRNNSDKKLFYTVLDIYPDNRVEVLYPYKNKEAADYMIDKKATVIRKLSVSKGSPAGTEFLKIIVSREPMDLRAVFEQTARRDELRSFQLVLDDLFNERDATSATRADISSVKAEEIGILSVHFTINKKEP